MDANVACLPDDLLLDILRRLPGRAVAVSRCVCRAWRDLVGAHTHGLLLPHVFPREFPGVFAHYYGYELYFALFGPPASGDAHQPRYRRLRLSSWDCLLKRHCNGLLLVEGGGRWSGIPYVCNPATSRYAWLPCPPTPWPCSVEGMFLAFDPAVSRHHQVFFFRTEKLQRYEEEEQHRTSSRAKLPCWVDWEHTSLPNLFGEEQPFESDGEEPTEEEQHDPHTQEPAISASQSNPEPEVPAAEVLKEKVFHVFVFSSQTGRWESREFTPGHCASGHLYDVVTAPRCRNQRTWWSAEYWRGSLYVHCHSGVLMVLHCPEGTYDMVQLPGHPHDGEIWDQSALPKRYLGSSDRGIRYAVINELQLEVWDLTELVDHQLGWTLAHRDDLKEHDRTMNYLRRNQPMMETKMTWAVVESSKDLISLFEHDNNEESNDDCGDGTGENVYKEGEEEVKVEEEEEDNYNEAQHGEKEQDSYDETENREKEEQGIYDNDEHAELQSSDGSDYSWNSDEHNFIDFDNNTITEEDVWGWGCNIVGFHPYKDVLLLKFSDAVVAYHLNTSRMQYLGDMYPRRFHQQACDVHAAFPYRPCYVDVLPPRKASRSC